MKDIARYHPFRLLILGLPVFVLCGCGGTSRNEMDVLPNPDKARAALEKALTAWKDGQKMGKVQGDAQSIEVVDKLWQSGGKLTAFEIVKAEDKPGPRWFSVKLTLAGSSAPQEARYAVLGLDPLWVFREEDYLRSCGMGN
jgi:hypothetical protein